MVQSRPLFVYFCPFIIAISITQIEKALTVCMGFVPTAAGWQVQMKPWSYGGRPTKLNEVCCLFFQFVNPETRDVRGPNEIGEICVKNPYTMLGYLNRPKHTKEFFDSDGFARTGDLGYYDDEGDIFFVDRLKELIK